MPWDWSKLLREREGEGNPIEMKAREGKGGRGRRVASERRAREEEKWEIYYKILNINNYVRLFFLNITRLCIYNIMAMFA